MKKIIFCFLVLSVTTFASDKKQIWIYTSIYKEFAQPLKEAFEKDNPDIEAMIFQGGSEKLQAKVEAELVAKIVT
jgi:putative heme iron utilization protein